MTDDGFAEVDGPLKDDRFKVNKDEIFFHTTVLLYENDISLISIQTWEVLSIQTRIRIFWTEPLMEY